MLKLSIETTEWVDKTHFLYTKVPDAVKLKVDSYLQTSNEIPALSEGLIDELDSALNFADELMYFNEANIKGAADKFNSLCDAIAYLSFCPCGIEIFGHRYEVIDGSCEA
jgi:hypothetical protein